MKTVKLAELRAGQIETEQADNMLEVVSTEDLSLGEHSFRLIVVDAAGNKSNAATVTIKVLDRTAPTAILSVLNANREVATEIAWGTTFYLSAEGSRDTPSAEAGGEVARYIWTMEPSG